MLIAYFPSYYVAHDSTDLLAYIKDFFIIEKWPVGPPWFIWVLFVFNLLFAFSNSIIQKFNKKADTLVPKFQDKPFLFFTFIFTVTWILYVPLAYNIGAGTWTGIGPFDFQLSRILLYYGYFMIGILIGNSDFNNGIFSIKSLLVRKWWLWSLLSLIIYMVLTINGRLNLLRHMVEDNKIKQFSAWMIYYTIYAASCTLSCIAFITAFRKLIKFPKLLWSSLSENAYLIYLIHYVFVIWIQFYLLRINVPAFLKFLLTFIISLLFSWGISILLRKFRLINKYL